MHPALLPFLVWPRRGEGAYPLARPVDGLNRAASKNLLVLVSVHLAMTSVFAEEVIKFPSPDGRFALSMGAWLINHFDSVTSAWITDSEAKPAAIIEQNHTSSRWSLRRPSGRARTRRSGLAIRSGWR